MALLLSGGSLFSQTVTGQKAPALTGLMLLDKKLPDIKNKFVFIDFWATWCQPCRKSLPHINNLAEKYKDNVIFLAISDEKENEVRNFLKNNTFSYLIFGLDIQKDLYSEFEIKTIPQYYLISPENTIVAHGYSSEISDTYLDSVICGYVPPTKANTASGIKISQDSTEKVSSIEIYEKPGSKSFLNQQGYTFVARDSLKTILPFLTGVKLFNRIRWQNIPRKMIEVKIFSRNIPFDSLKMVAHNQILRSYGITMSNVSERASVYNFRIKNSKLLKDKNTVVEDGVLYKREPVNDSTYRLDNYTFKSLISFLEQAYYPRIFYAENPSPVEYDWEIQMINPNTHKWVSFEELKTVLRKVCGIEIKETKKRETFTLYK
jgi:thiol-disulfide isomerase/thioredoxin